MPSTYDYDKVNSKQFLAQLWGAKGEDPFAHCLLSEYHNSKTAAQNAMRKAYREHAWSAAQLGLTAIWGEIRQGEWVDSSFEDSELGWINDAEWDDEGKPRASVYPSTRGALRFEWEDLS